jgi:6-phosphofructokinase 2
MKIATLTLNPALDKSSSAERIQPEKKIRCDAPRYDPGGGGLNVSRAIKILGGDSIAIYAAGGSAGERIEELLEKEGIQQKHIKTKNPTRENFAVMESSSGDQFRFGMPGYEIYEDELQQCIDAINELPDTVEYLVGSGSLPPGAPVDFYGKVAKLAIDRNIKCVIDTSGEALAKAAEMGVCMMKPNLRELSLLAGKEKISGLEQEEIARKVIDQGQASILVVSLGARGAMIASKESIEYVVPPTVNSVSKVGAGDSMVGAIVLSLSRGESLKQAIRWGVAAGTAATMTPGTELCRRQDVEEIYQWLKSMQ